MIVVPEIKDEYDLTNFQMLYCSEHKLHLLQAIIDIANEMKRVKRKEYRLKSILIKFSISAWLLLFIFMIAQCTATGVWLYSFIYVVAAAIG